MAYKDPRDSDEQVFIKSKNIHRLTFYGLVFFIVGLSVFYMLGTSLSQDVSSGLAYHPSVAECIIYTHEVYITNIECTLQEDCAPDGICLTEFNRCANFIE
jgi:hypothetical protein